MRNRLFHIPRFHTATMGTEKRASWLELFYDLIYVAAFIQLGTAFSKSISFDHLIISFGIFVALWLTWTGFTYYSSRYTINDFIFRICVFLQMFAAGAMAMSIPDLLVGNPYKFGIAYAVAQFIIALMHLRSYIQQPHARDYATYWGGVFLLSVIFWVGGLFFPNHFYVGWIIGSLFIMLAPFSPKARYMETTYPFDFHHLSERYGILTIIVLGESFVKVLTGINTIDLGVMQILQASFALLLTCSMWWIYFEDVDQTYLRADKFSMVIWLLAHIPLQFSLILLGVGVSKIVPLFSNEGVPFNYAFLLSASIGVVLICTAIIDSVLVRQDAEMRDTERVGIRFFSGILMIVLGLASGTFHLLWFISAILFVCIFQIAFNLFFSPHEIHESDIRYETKSNSDVTFSKSSQSINHLQLDPIRKGVPTEFRKDLYFYFMEASWTVVFIALSFAYLISNLFFASLYMIFPGAVSGMDITFVDAFFFSVQTMSTIGYGTLYPTGIFSNVIVTFEAAYSLLSVAFITGMVFAKISRPRAKILFSRSMIDSVIDGKRSLSFRMGNARGNDIVEATVSLAALIDEETSEGHHVRRVYQLPLVRSKTPFFRLTWTVTHVIDENSPIYSLDFSDDRLKGIVATVTGHDGTYSNTVYMRHNYTADDIVKDKYFADIIFEMEDGRIMVDYHQFHSLRE